MLGLKLIHVSTRGVWQASYCNMKAADIQVSTQKRTPDISIRFADITGLIVSRVCYYRLGLSSIIMRLHNIFFTKKCSLVLPCVPLKPSQPAVSCMARSSCTDKLGKLWCNVSYGLKKKCVQYLCDYCHWCMQHRSGCSSIRTHHCIQIQWLLSSNLAQTPVVFNSLKTHYWIMITCISYENIFAPLYTCVIGIIVPIRYYDMGYMGFKVEQY